MPEKGNTSRRDFLKKCATGAAILGAGGAAPWLEAGDQAAPQGKSKVVMAHDPVLRGSGTSVDSQRILSLLDRSMQALFDRNNASEAWRKLVRPGERVGLKVNTIAGRGLSTNVQLVEAICERLQGAGIKAGDIIIWDRDTNELERAGFRSSTDASRVRCFGTDRVGYEDELATYGSVGSRLSKILTQNCDALINVPLVKDHGVAGITLSLKNMYGVIHNPNKYHPNNCDPYVADLNMLPEIRSKIRVTICDATTCGYEGGPSFNPGFSWKLDSLLLSQDPVALDYTGWQIIERKRAEKGLKTLEAAGRAPRHIATAADAQHRLGTNDPKRIAVVEI